MCPAKNAGRCFLSPPRAITSSVPTAARIHGACEESYLGGKPMDCWTCKSNTGEKRISPGPTIFEGKYWLVEHAYPIKRLGWLVIVLKRHAEALHELTAEEFVELGQILSRVINVLFEETHCEKEYVSCYAETEHFHHVHFHVFA